ncbi:MAG: tRNA (adenosine(37)-N6)-dimethylallyltransferase MiaA [Candidatus Roizmanbacteria bacterium]
MPSISILTGQTATGKTEKAVKLAKETNGEIISADSRQIYTHLDIITGKDRVEGVSFWGYDLVDPKQIYSSYDFAHYAKDKINDIVKRGKHPIIVGGTYLYIQELLYGSDQKGVSPNQELRTKLSGISIGHLQTMLQNTSRVIWEGLNESDKKNPQRLIRKIEIAQSGQTISPISKTPNYDLTSYGCFFFKDQKELEETISQRVQKRIEQGAENEVKKLLEMGYTKDDPGLKTIGYTQLIKYLEGSISYEKALEEWIRSEIQYAKRQKTFMKRDPNLKIKYV